MQYRSRVEVLARDTYSAGIPISKVLRRICIECSKLLYLSFYLWLTYLIYTYVASQERLRGLAFAMLFQSYVIVLLGSYNCQELHYL